MKTVTLSAMCVVLVFAFTACDSRNTYKAKKEYQELAEKAEQLARTQLGLNEALANVRANLANDTYAGERERRSSADYYLQVVRGYNRDAEEYGFDLHRTGLGLTENLPEGEKPLPSGFKRYDEMPEEIVKK